MMMLSQAWQHFHFLRPTLFLALLPVLWFAYQNRKQDSGLGAWKKVVAPQLLAYLKVGEQSKASLAWWWLTIVAAILLTVAMAGPVWQKLPQPVYAAQSALVVVLDLSKSMNAADFKPSRLTRAKQKLTDILHTRAQGQSALVVFAGSAFVVTPLTDDNATILSQLQGLTTDIMPAQGGHIDTGLEKALDLLKQAAVPHGRVLLMTDSDTYSEATVTRLVQAGHRLDVIGIGKPEGAPIPEVGGGFVRDRLGNIVIVKLHEDTLRKLALLGQGSYHRLSVDDSDIAMLTQPSVKQMWQEGAKQSKATYDTWQEEGYWLLLPALLLLLPLFRKGMLVIVFMLIFQPAPSDASAWQNVWQTPDKQGESLMQRKDFEQAQTVFKDLRWKAAAAYRNQDYQAALDSLSAVENPSAEDWYNQGNALAKLGKLDEAIAAYDKALTDNPEHRDALANKKLIEKVKKQQNQAQNKEDKHQQKQDQQGQDKNKKEQSNQGQNKKEKGGKQNKNDQHQEKPENQDQKSGQSLEQEGKQGKHKKPKSPKEQGQSQNEQNKSKQEKRKEKQGVQAQEDKRGKQDKKDKQVKSELATVDEMQKTEAQQIFEQQLRRVPDDPSGLLRRKFLYQYQRRANSRTSRGEKW